jgi:hypothetical protein
MSEQHEELTATVKELEGELHSLQSVDDETRAILKELLDEIRVVLHEDNTEDTHSQSMMERLNHAAHEFEAAHPTVAGTLNRLIDGLGQIGI